MSSSPAAQPMRIAGRRPTRKHGHHGRLSRPPRHRLDRRHDTVQRPQAHGCIGAGRRLIGRIDLDHVEQDIEIVLVADAVDAKALGRKAVAAELRQMTSPTVSF